MKLTTGATLKDTLNFQGNICDRIHFRKCCFWQPILFSRRNYNHMHSPGIFPKQSKSKSSYTQVVIKLPRKNVELFSAWKRYVRLLMHLRFWEISKTVKLLWKHCNVAVTHGCSYLRVAYSTIKARIIHRLIRSKVS